MLHILGMGCVGRAARANKGGGVKLNFEEGAHYAPKGTARPTRSYCPRKKNLSRSFVDSAIQVGLP